MKLYYMMSGAYFTARLNQIKEEVSEMRLDFVTQDKLQEIKNDLIQKYSIEELGLELDSREAFRDTKNMSSGYYNQLTMDSYTAFKKPTIEVLRIEIPYRGDSMVACLQPSSFTISFPAVEWGEDRITLKIPLRDKKDEDLKSEVERDTNILVNHFNQLNEDIAGFNDNLRDEVEKIVKLRLDQIRPSKTLMESLGIPRKIDTEKGERVIQKKAEIKINPNDPYVESEVYNGILELINERAVTMEQNPGGFCDLKEEALRDIFLGDINMRYEGGATAETFNAVGKTDICFKIKNKNVFIAECKIWSGSKDFEDAIDQLLNYLTWRDCKTALMVFCKNMNISGIHEKMDNTIKNHKNYLSNTKTNSSMCKAHYVLKSNKDDAQNVIVSIGLVHIPL